MARAFWISCVGLWVVVGASQVTAQEIEASASGNESESLGIEEGDACFPPCRSGYLCHPVKAECVQLCNPPCASDEVCTEAAECVAKEPTTAAPTGASREPTTGDRRFRMLFLGRFGLGGRLKVKFDDFFAGAGSAVGDARATLGFDLRFEKPVTKYVSVGGLISNYWFGPEGGDRQYALDIAPFVKPRIPFRVGNQEAEVYLLFNIGGSLTSVEFVDPTGFNLVDEVYGGFNFGLAPGFQFFVADGFAIVFDVGYAFTWFKIGGDSNLRWTLGQATVRVGFAAAF